MPDGDARGVASICRVVGHTVTQSARGAGRPAGASPALQLVRCSRTTRAPHEPNSCVPFHVPFLLAFAPFPADFIPPASYCEDAAGWYSAAAHKHPTRHAAPCAVSGRSVRSALMMVESSLLTTPRMVYPVALQVARHRQPKKEILTAATQERARGSETVCHEEPGASAVPLRSELSSPAKAAVATMGGIERPLE